MVNELYHKLKSFFLKSKMEAKIDGDFNSAEEIHLSSTDFYEENDLVYFKNLNAYGAFKYPIVKQLFNSENESIGVSNVALEINDIYFSKNEDIHKMNKKAAILHLTFLSSKLHYLNNDYTHFLFNKFLTNLPTKKEINLVDFLVNPLVLINILKEYDLLDTIFQDLNPENDSFSFDYAINKIKEYFEDTSKLESVIKKFLEQGGIIPAKMIDFLNDLETENPIEIAQLPNFFKSIIFVAVETTSSFLSNFIFTIFQKYPEFLLNKDVEKLHQLSNELLRINPPVPFIFRTVWEDTVFNDVHLKKGDQLILFVGSANMDPNYFDEPDLIKFNRNNKHLSFGGGAYTCIGRFASFRMALNIFDYLAPLSNNFSFLEKKPRFYFQNAILKIPLNIKYYDSFEGN